LGKDMLRRAFVFALRSGLAGAESFALLAACSLIARPLAATEPVHGLWIWKSAWVLEAPNAAEALVKFCAAENINEVYISVSARSAAAEEPQLALLIALLHQSNIRAEALLSSADADEPGKHRDTFLRHVQEIVKFNQRHVAERFDGVHLDIEPQQRPENKGPGNLGFLSDLVETFRAAQAIAEPARLTVNVDIQSKLLRGDIAERKMLLSAVPRVTLMMYELSSPGDGDSPEQQGEKAQKASQKFLNMAYAGLPAKNVAGMAIALRTPDYGELLPQMLKKLDDANRGNPRYLGWAWHAYGDYLKSAQ
jgi:hypothetical protein